jgi:hypothetical protein
MCVHQTRALFLKRDGYIVDNPNVGPILTNAYWKFGNERNFLDLVKELTGTELSGEAWVATLEKDTEEHIVAERKEFQKAIEDAKQITCKDENEPDLNMTIRFVDGDVMISDSSTDGVLKACKEFESYVLAKIGK